MHKLKRYIAGILSAAMMLCSAGAMPIYAAESTSAESKTTDNCVWMRAKAEYSLSGMSDQGTTFASGWTKGDGDWYYYKDKVELGKEITFIESVTVPTTLTNKESGNKFTVKVFVEAEQAFSGSEGWNANRSADYSQSYSDAAKSDNKNLTFSQGTIHIAINEYQKDANGNVTAYTDNKSVVPGQKISKIVKIKLTGKVGNVTETKKKEETPKTTPTTTPKPSTVASATDQAGVPNVTSVGSVMNDGVPGTGDNAPTAILAICWLVAAIGFACFMGQKKKRGGERRDR